MTHHVMAYGTHVLGYDITALFEEGIRTRSQSQIDRRTGRCPKGNHIFHIGQPVVLRETSGKYDVYDITLDFLIDIDLLHNLTGIDYIFGFKYRFYFGTLTRNILTYDKLFFFFLGVIDDDLQEETVHLSLGQRICSFLLDRILSRHYEERIIELIGIFTDSYLTLLHGFEQSTLHFGRSTVYFIGKDKVSKNRTFLYLKLFFGLTIHHRTDNIGRKQVGRKLYTAVLRIDERSKGFDSKGFGQSRHTFEQYVPIGQKAYHQRIDEMFLPHNNAVHTHSNHVYK